MERPSIDIREDGSATIFWRGHRYRREPDDKSGFSWRDQTEGGHKSVRRSCIALFNWTYEHPEAAYQIRRFPRLPPVETNAPIKGFFDIPLTTNLPRQNLRWLVDGLFPEGELILLTGVPGSFKSLLVDVLAAAVSQGRDFLGRATRQTMVLLLDRDNPLHVIALRRDMLRMSEGRHLRIWGNWQGDTPLIGDPRLTQMARDHRLLIVFDSFVRFHSADENTTQQMVPIMAELRKLTMLGATVIVLHHSPKSEPRKNRYRGSSDIHAAVDAAFNLSVNRKTSPPTLTLECFKQRAIEEFTITIRPDFDHGRFEVIGDSTAQESTQDAEQLKALIGAEPGLNQEKLIKRSGLPEHRARKVLRDGEDIHWKVERPGKKEKTYHPIP